jgi:predicted GNAT family acetyltransferase
MGIEGESERIASNACSAVDVGRSGECGQSGQAFGDLGAANEAITAQERGVEGLLHGNRGKPPWNKTALGKTEKVIQLARGRYQGLNDTHLTEKLKEKEKISVSRPTVRRVLRGAGVAAVMSRYPRFSFAHLRSPAR